MTIVLAANNDTLELIREMGRPDVGLQFDNGVGVDYLAPEPRSFKADDSPVRLIWVGRMLPRKALPMALDALAKVKHDWILTIVGNGMAEAEVRQMIAERKLTDRVHWAEKTSDMGRSSCSPIWTMMHCWFTSLRETSGVQLLEAMALGLPVITSGFARRTRCCS